MMSDLTDFSDDSYEEPMPSEATANTTSVLTHPHDPILDEIPTSLATAFDIAALDTESFEHEPYI